MNLLLDTHFVLWVLASSPRLERYPWLDDHRPWGVSPISLLELQYLAEIGRLEMLDAVGLEEALGVDPRFVVDEPPLSPLIRHALALGWTRDPFDRLLVAHSLTRRVPLCTTDRTIRANHGLVVEGIG